MMHTRVVSCAQQDQPCTPVQLDACMEQCSYVAIYLNKGTFSGNGALEVAAAVRWCLSSDSKDTSLGTAPARVILLHEQSIAGNFAPFSDILEQFPANARFLLKHLALPFNAQTPELLQVSAFKVMQKMRGLDEAKTAPAFHRKLSKIQ